MGDPPDDDETDDPDDEDEGEEDDEPLHGAPPVHRSRPIRAIDPRPTRVRFALRSRIRPPLRRRNECPTPWRP